MATAHSFSSPQPLPPPDPEVEAADAARTAHQLSLAAELAEMGMTLARAAFIRAQQNPSSAADAAYNRIARAAERALALEAWLLRHRRARATEHAVRKASADRLQRTTQRRQLRQDVEQEVAKTPHFTRVQRLRIERYMDDFTAYGELTRPIPEILAAICHDLGIALPTPQPVLQPPKCRAPAHISPSPANPTNAQTGPRPTSLTTARRAL